MILEIENAMRKKPDKKNKQTKNKNKNQDFNGI